MSSVRATEAEYAVLGSVMLEPDRIGEVLALGLTPQMFMAEKTATVFSAMMEMDAKQGAIDIVTVTQYLADRNRLDQIGGVDTLVEMSESVPSAVSAAHYGRLVLNAYKKVRIGEIVERASKRLADGGDSAEELACAIAQELDGVAEGQKSAKLLSRQKAAQDAYEEIERRAEHGPISGVRTGFGQLDHRLGGMHPGNLYLVAGRPGSGKTALALQMAVNAAASGSRSLFVSIEMPPDQVGIRDLAYRAGLDLQKIRDPARMSRDEWGSLQEAVGATRDDLNILDASGLRMEQIESHAKRLKAMEGLDFIVIDYLQLMASPSDMKKYEAVGRNSKLCKQLARKLALPVVLLSQVNRTSEHTSARRPQLSSLRDSGEVEESADAVMLVHREDYYRLQDDPDAALDYVAEIIVAKSRNGPVGITELEFRDGAFANPLGL